MVADPEGPHLSRGVFQAATGYRPIDYVLALRVEEAKQMLETGGAR